MDNKIPESIKSILSTKKKIILIPHSSPDADALGSCLALFHFFKNDHNVSVISPNEFTEILNFLPGSENVIVYEFQKEKSDVLFDEAEIIFTLDFNSLGRAKNVSYKISKSSAKIIMIDHHENPDDYADFMISNSKMSSTSEMIYDFISYIDSNKIDNNIATCLYTGIVADTGSYRFPSTTSRTLLVGSKLIDYGVDVTQIFESLHNNFQFDRLKLLGITINNFKKVEDLPVLYSLITDEDQKSSNFKKGDSEGFVNFGLSVEGILCSVLFLENKEDELIKISFRSKGDFKVNIFASRYFNGGGHIHAAGGISKLNLIDTEKKFISDIKQYLKEYYD
ncbi:MAG: bifunctional oligoribonuclease/PAP phosphatase NrnA [Flavobacteriaceae bacterium]|nr:bifunctional oligoribonuclease/PAP phosphatase NrnA [Cryomorphaceae bacterium]MBL6677459.1 bifunctional oligoribonuclease/PAP phosphatase NrnA [Flavobacteriaceae bacterium]